ncbi:MAG TPA: alpha/beta hydrolase [Acetobacteraceae bacterium]|nr:alpha/beta hydrolase [Acetobacteraceae bacterium]
MANGSLLRSIGSALSRLPLPAPADLVNACTSLRGLQVARGLAYGAHPRQKLDVYRLAVARPGQPLVIFFYGGSWSFGRRQDYRFLAARLARGGAVVAVPDYRLFPEVRFPGFIADAAAATAWLMARTAALGAAPQPILAGHSAGAYLVAMLALDPRWLAETGVDRTQLAGVIGLAGPYDFLPIRDPDIQPIFASAADLAETQPINHVDGENPPMLLAAGVRDRVVAPRNTAALATRIRAMGGMVETRVYPGMGHLGIIGAFAPVLHRRRRVVADVTAFITACAGAETPADETSPAGAAG